MPCPLSLNNTQRQRANLLFALTQFTAPFFSQLTGWGMSIEARSTVNPVFSPEVPAGYAFSIWFVIFTLSLIYGVYQALPAQRDTPLFRRIGTPTASLFLLSTVWMLITQLTGDGWPLVVIIILMLLAALAGFFAYLSYPAPYSRFDRWVVGPFLGMVSAWLSLAVFLNFASVIKMTSLHTLGLSYTYFAILILLPAIALGLTVLSKSRGNLWYAGTLLWGLAGIAVTNSVDAPNTLVLVASILLSVVVIARTILARRKKSFSAVDTTG